MKGIVQFAVTAALVAGAAADLAGDNHHHQQMHRHRALNIPAHRHQRREAAAAAAAAAAQVEKRATPVKIETKYVYADGGAVAAAEAQKCIEDGECIVVGKSTPTPTTAETTSATKVSTKPAAEFFESKKTTTTSTSTTPTTTSTTSTSTTSSSTSTTPTTTSTTAAATPTAAAAPKGKAAAAASDSSSSGGGLTSTFTSGTVPCSHFPSDYGALAVPWVGLDGWASIQDTGSWTPGSLISDIVEPITGPCTSGSFCAYACPPGYSKTQWPKTSQGATGQSIGGLWCNADGFLELTNPDFDTLCVAGLGGISIRNELSDVACVCGTNYPGNEMMNVPLVTSPGGTFPLNNLDAKTAYQWQGKYTSGQFYVNNAGVSEEQACVWTSSKYPTSAGNWAPVNIGAGTDINGITYISIFPNTPTSTAVLNFDIEITGGITAPCYLKSGAYYGGSNGCTTALKTGGSAVIVFKAKGSS